jgi:hypothetical protein
VRKWSASTPSIRISDPLVKSGDINLDEERNYGDYAREVDIREEASRYRRY